MLQILVSATKPLGCAPASQRLVNKLRWMSEEVYGELFALGQFMPGPTSTQVSFAIGIVKKGVTGEWTATSHQRLLQ